MAAKSIRVNTKKRGRPKTTGKGQLVGVRLHADQLTALDIFAAEQGLTRPAAVRLAVREFLIGHGTMPPEGDD